MEQRLAGRLTLSPICQNVCYINDLSCINQSATLGLSENSSYGPGLVPARICSYLRHPRNLWSKGLGHFWACPPQTDCAMPSNLCLS